VGNGKVSQLKCISLFPEGIDVKKYKIMNSGGYKPLKYELEIKTVPNKYITQPLPLLNITS